MRHEDKLAAVERLIVDFRWARSAGPTGLSELENQTYRALKEIAAEMRAAKPSVPGETVSLLQREVTRAVASKTHLGFNAGNLVAIGQLVVGRWREVGRALREAAERQQATEEETLG